MNTKRLSIILLVLIFSVSVSAQKSGIKLTGKVYDLETNTPIPGVSIQVNKTLQATSTDKNGSFTLNIKETPAMLNFSHIGYGSREFKVQSTDTLPVNIYLKTKVETIGEVTISGRRIAKLIPGDTLNIIDYELYGDQIVLLANPYKHADDQRLYLTSHSGDVLSSKKVYGAGVKIDVPESIDYSNWVYLFKDCFSTIQFLSNEAVYQVFIRNDSLFLIYPVQLAKFVDNLMPAKAAFGNHLFIQKTTRLRNDTYLVTKGDSTLRLVKTVYDPHGDFRYARPIDFNDGLLPASEYLMANGSYERCVTAPVIKRKNDIVIFDFFGNNVEFFTPEGVSVGSVPITFHLKTYNELLFIKMRDIDLHNFTQKILYDEKADRIWSVWTPQYSGHYTLKEVDPNTGELIKTVVIPDLPFIDKIQINNNIVYFIYKEKEYPYNNSLYRMII